MDFELNTEQKGFESRCAALPKMNCAMARLRVHIARTIHGTYPVAWLIRVCLASPLLKQTAGWAAH